MQPWQTLAEASQMKQLPVAKIYSKSSQKCCSTESSIQIMHCPWVSKLVPSFACQGHCCAIQPHKKLSFPTNAQNAFHITKLQWLECTSLCAATGSFSRVQNTQKGRSLSPSTLKAVQRPTATIISEGVREQNVFQTSAFIEWMSNKPLLKLLPNNFLFKKSYMWCSSCKLLKGRSHRNEPGQDQNL